MSTLLLILIYAAPPLLHFILQCCVDNSCCLVNIALETETCDVLRADDVVNIFYAWR